LEPFSLLLALLPLIGYLLVFSLIRLSGKALVTTGARDIAALAIGISGILAVGPAELFFPTAAATFFGPVVWIALAVFYGLTVTLIGLTSQPKLVVYGRTPEELFEPLLTAARQLDPQSYGDDRTLQVTMPSIGIRVRVDGQRGIDYSQVLAFEPNASPVFWHKLLASLRISVAESNAVPRRGFGMLLAAVVMSSILVWQSLGNRDLVVEGFRDWLWR
jgi:hypothetical protein